MKLNLCFPLRRMLDGIAFSNDFKFTYVLVRRKEIALTLQRWGSKEVEVVHVIKFSAAMNDHVQFIE